MRLLFLVPLSLGLICGYFSRNSDEDIAYLTGVISIVCFLLSLFISPWQIQVLILVILLINFRRLFPQNEPKIKEEVTVTTEKDQENSMQKNSDPNTIKYRGVTYNLHSTETSISEGEIVGKYRGKVFRAHHLAENLKLKPDSSNSKYKLKYRGIDLNNSKNSD